jgi:uncharacterized RDD family membrane protein YckC
LQSQEQILIFHQHNNLALAINLRWKQKKHQTAFKRLLAAIIDGVIFLPLLYIERFLNQVYSSTLTHFAWEAIHAFLPIVYSIILHYKSGQTIGKWVTGIRVLDLSETRKLTFLQSVLRDSFYLLMAIVAICYFAFKLSNTENTDMALSDYSNFSSNALIIWTVLELLTMFTNLKKRTIHDYIAGSVVIRTSENKANRSLF